MYCMPKMLVYNVWLCWLYIVPGLLFLCYFKIWQVVLFALKALTNKFCMGNVGVCNIFLLLCLLVYCILIHKSSLIQIKSVFSRRLFVCFCTLLFHDKVKTLLFGCNVYGSIVLSCCVKIVFPCFPCSLWRQCDKWLLERYRLLHTVTVTTLRGN